MTGEKTYARLLGSTSLFGGLSDRTLRRISATVSEVAHPDGKSVVVEGRGAHAMHVIVDGTAVVSIGGSEVARLGPGDSFGEVSLFDKGPRTATVTADGPLRVLAIDGVAIHGLIESDGQLGLRILGRLAAALRSSNGALAEWQFDTGGQPR